MDPALIVYLHIEAGVAEHTLGALAASTDLSIMFPGGLFDDAPTRAVNGRYGVFEAWCALLEGSGLTFQIDGRWVHVRREVHPAERDALCQDKPTGWGPDFIRLPVADWK